MIEKDRMMPFLWRIIYSHIIAYFIAGLFAVTFMNYKEHYASETLSLLMRPVDSPIVALGPMLQIIRGLIIGLVLYPLRKCFVEDKNGFRKLALLIFGLSAVSTIGPTPGSFEGIVYTILPIQYHLLGIPETIIYVLLFTVILNFSYKNKKGWVYILPVVLVCLIFIFSILGYFDAIGKL